MRLLVTWGPQRTKRWPDVPTLKELGYDMTSTSPYGIAGPKGMDPKVAKVLHDASGKAWKDPGTAGDGEIRPGSPLHVGEEYAKFARATFAAEKATMARLLRDAEVAIASRRAPSAGRAAPCPWATPAAPS
jgi:tripartite-type tricarboxylate transporter receptor subunit TctC